MTRKIRHLTVTGDDRDATWKLGVGIYVDGFGFGKADAVEIEGTAHEVTDMQRIQLEGGGGDHRVALAEKRR